MLLQRFTAKLVNYMLIHIESKNSNKLYSKAYNFI